MKSCCKDAFENDDFEKNEQKTSALERLRTKWKVRSIFQVVLILITFSIGGSICGYLGKLILNLFAVEAGTLWLVLYLVLVTILWPVCVLVVSVFFGQFTFFKGYIYRMARRMFGKKESSPELPIK